jgi:hypothetical protein
MERAIVLHMHPAFTKTNYHSRILFPENAFGLKLIP